MKLVTFQKGNTYQAGIVLGERILDISPASGGQLPSEVRALLASGEAQAFASQLVRRAQEEPDFMQQFSLPFSSARLVAPIPRPGKILCLGLNYRDHAAESGAELPSEPIVFSKAPTSVIGPGEPILLPAASDKVDYEVELAFVIGKPGKNVSAEAAMEHVAGYTVLNDVSARDYQREKPGGQWHLAKSFDTFAPLGPWIVTADEIPDPHRLALRCVINGKTMQDSNTSEMIFRIPEIIEYLTRVLTLETGDVVATGTPPGVGFARKPPRFLRSGDIVQCIVEGIGTLENPVQAEGAGA